jgi:hypothetical protein
VNTNNELAREQTLQADAVTSQAVALNLTATAAQFSPTPLAQSTVELDKRLAASDVVPTLGEINQVRARLGDKSRQ